MNEHLSKITIYGTAWCPDCKRAKQFWVSNAFNTIGLTSSKTTRR